MSYRHFLAIIPSETVVAVREVDILFMENRSPLETGA